jgi:hypothetical protein
MLRTACGAAHVDRDAGSLPRLLPCILGFHWRAILACCIERRRLRWLEQTGWTRLLRASPRRNLTLAKPNYRHQKKQREQLKKKKKEEKRLRRARTSDPAPTPTPTPTPTPAPDPDPDPAKPS